MLYGNAIEELRLIIEFTIDEWRNLSHMKHINDEFLWEFYGSISAVYGRLAEEIDGHGRKFSCEKLGTFGVDNSA